MADPAYPVDDSSPGHRRRRHRRGGQLQPVARAQQGRGAARQLQRFMGTTSGRKLATLVTALDLDRVPRPLDAVLADVTR